MQDRIRQCLDAVQKYVEDHDYKGYDPGDGLTSFLRSLTFGNLFAERILQQVIWKFPFNLRPIAGVKPLDSSKGRGFMAWGYLLRYKSEGHTVHLNKALQCLDWLDQNKEAEQLGHCWGNHFDFTTRSGRMKAHTPTIVWSGLIGQAFLEAYELTGEKRWLTIADGICSWIMSLPRETTERGCCISYFPHEQCSIHNSNMLGAAMLARTARHTGNKAYQQLALLAMEYSCSRQLPDGSWWYGEATKHRWIDNFHTAYNLDSLKRYIDATADTAFGENLERGYSYFKTVFFEKNGRPRYYNDRTYPVDIQCAGQAIDTFAFFSDRDPEALSLAQKVADWTITNMQDRSGYFYYRQYPLLTARTPYFHWGQGTMFKGLSHLALRLSSAAEAKPHGAPTATQSSLRR